MTIFGCYPDTPKIPLFLTTWPHVTDIPSFWVYFNPPICLLYLLLVYYMLYMPCCILPLFRHVHILHHSGCLIWCYIRVIISCVPPCHTPPSAMSCFMSPTDVTIRYATSMSCSLPPPVSPPAMPYHHPVPYTLFDIPPCHMSHTPPPSVSPCDATCRDHAIQSAYVFFMRDVFGTP